MSGKAATPDKTKPVALKDTSDLITLAYAKDILRTHMSRAQIQQCCMEGKLAGTYIGTRWFPSRTDCFRLLLELESR